MNEKRQKCDAVTDVSPILAHKLRFEGEVYDPVRIPSGIGWMRYTKEGQEIVPNPVIEINGIKYKCSLPASIPEENLILPSAKGEQRSGAELFDTIRSLLKSVVQFENEVDLDFLAMYVLSTWTYDEPVDSLNYIAFTGIPGTGKSQALLASTNLSFNCLVGGGADSDSALFRSIHAIKGTLAVDEAQKSSHESGSIYHKILALGNQPHGSISRSRQVGTKGTFETDTFSIFGPKIFSARSVPAEEAILSRTYNITMPLVRFEDLAVREMNPFWKAQTGSVRNDLLFYRQQRALGKKSPPALEYSNDDALEFSSRDHQVYRWLLRECPTTEILKSILRAINSNKERMAKGRVLQVEPQVLLAAYDCVANKRRLSKEVAKRMCDNGYLNIDAHRVGKTLRSNGLEVHHSRDGARIESSAKEIEQALLRLGFTVDGSRASQASQNQVSNGGSYDELD